MLVCPALVTFSSGNAVMPPDVLLVSGLTSQFPEQIPAVLRQQVLGLGARVACRGAIG